MADTTPGTPDTVYSEPAAESTNEITFANNKEPQHHQTQDEQPTYVDNAPSSWYDSCRLSSEELAGLDTILVFDRPDNGRSYAQLSCGLWYLMDKDDHPFMMSQEEYEDLLAWFASLEKEEDVESTLPVVLITDEEGNESVADYIVYSAPFVITANQPIFSPDHLSPYATKATTPTSVDRIPSGWYHSSFLLSQDPVNLDAAEVIDRPDNRIAYAQLADGLWYRLDESNNALMMTQEEYEDLLTWFNSFNQVKQEVNLFPPMLLVTDEEGNQFLAQEAETNCIANQNEDIDHTRNPANETITITD